MRKKRRRGNYKLAAATSAMSVGVIQIGEDEDAAQREAVLDVYNVRRMDTRAILHVGSLLDDFSPTAKLRNVTGIMSLEMYGQT